MRSSSTLRVLFFSCAYSAEFVSITISSSVIAVYVPSKLGLNCSPVCFCDIAIRHASTHTNGGFDNYDDNHVANKIFNDDENFKRYSCLFKEATMQY